ncbi:hypothetical protein XH99_01100 [Bradyrhizobium nanningense]|uniref:Uncharacterized protein n=1 Tax=Bradyrhizobium nanningense TaxID=1325118 RepID=A0A4Q0SKX2_9BRAD|nr:hypothetical protein XH84_07060 [Bradyrhizobium nanningense]RXH38386.1 hypothetical protein XH99_01100 [Bradyrhizobium nanningense]
MQVHDQGGEEFELPRQPAVPVAFDFFSPSDEVLAFAKPCGDRVSRAVLSAIALIASFGLGWAGGQNWPQVVSAFGLSSVAQKEVPSRRLAKTAPAARHTGISKPSLAAALQAPPNANATFNYGPTINSTIAAAVARVSSESTGTVSLTQSTNVRAPGAAALDHLAPPPETKPTTIQGWAVIDVRDGTAVLDGPYGPRMARLGDTIPGIGRVDSIVHWGNRWIVATSNGLIATP